MSTITSGEERAAPIGPDQPEDSPLTYCMVHGSWHSAGCWDDVRPVLEAAGHETLAPDLPTDTDATYDELAAIISSAIRDERNTILVVTSRAGNLATRVACELDLLEVDYVCAGFDGNASKTWLPGLFRRKPPKKYSQDFIEGIHHDENDRCLTIFDPDKAKHILYNDCPPEVQDKAVEQLKWTYRHDSLQPVRHWPQVPTTFIMAEKDKVYNPDYLRFVAGKWLGVRAVRMSGDHCPYYSRPRELAQILLARETVKTDY